MAKATEIDCPKCHAKVHMRFAGKDGIQCKRCYYWIPRDIMLKLVYEQEGEPVVIQPEPEEEESFAVCPKCRHKTFYSKIMDGGVMCKKCYNWIVVEEEPEIPPIIEEVLMQRHVSPHIHTTENKHIPQELPKPPEKSKEKKSEENLQDKKDKGDSWYISQEDLISEKNAEQTEEKKDREEKDSASERSSFDRKKGKKYKPRRKDFASSDGGKRKIKAKSPGKESRVFKKATKKLVTRRKHDKEAEPETHAKETSAEAAENAPVLVTPAPEIKEQPKIESKQSIEKSAESKVNTGEVLIPAVPESQMKDTEQSEPALAMPAPAVKEEKADTEAIELPISVKDENQRSKPLSDETELQIPEEPPLELPPPSQKIAEPSAVEEKAIPVEPVKKTVSSFDKQELDEDFIAAYLPGNISADILSTAGKEDRFTREPEEITALMPETDMADEDILDFLVEPPEFNFPGMDAVEGEDSTTGSGEDALDSTLTDSAIMQIQQPEIVVRQIPASMRPKMTSILSKPSKSDDLDLPQKTDFSTTKLPSKPPVERISDNVSGSAKPSAPSQTPVKSTSDSKGSLLPIKPSHSDKPDAVPVRPPPSSAVSVRMRTPEVKKHSLPAPSTGHKGGSHPPAGTQAQPDTSVKPVMPDVSVKPSIAKSTAKPAVSDTRSVTKNVPPVRKSGPGEEKTSPPSVKPEKPVSSGPPHPSILTRKIIAPKKIDISGVFKKKQ